MTTADNSYIPISFTVGEHDVHDCSLVLSSASIPHRVTPDSGNGYLLLVRDNDLHRAEYELDAYFLENRNWPMQPPDLHSYEPLFKAQSLLMMGLMMVFFGITGSWTERSPWFQAGAATSSLIIDEHQIYRTITALTLHADIVHLLGNCFLGGILLHFYLHLTGNGIGTMALLFASASANYINALAHGPDHNSVGFSTAVFAIIGILSSLNFNRYRFSRPMQLAMPFMAGAALLAMLGASGERTDLGAHFFGLATGLATGVGLILIRIEHLRHHCLLQALLNAIAITLIILAWRFAMA